MNRAAVLSPTTSRAIAAGALTVAVLHNIDEAFVHPEDGGITSLVVDAIFAVLFIWSYPRLGRRTRIGLLAVAGTLVLLTGFAGHALRVIAGQGAGADWSGLAYTASGLVLLWLAFQEWHQA